MSRVRKQADSPVTQQGKSKMMNGYSAQKFQRMVTTFVKGDSKQAQDIDFKRQVNTPENELAIAKLSQHLKQNATFKVPL